MDATHFTRPGEAGLETSSHPQNYQGRFVTRYQRKAFGSSIDAWQKTMAMLTDASAYARQNLDDDVAKRIESTTHKVGGCCHDPQVRQDDDTGEIWLTRSCCRHRLCPVCQAMRSRGLRCQVAEVCNAMNSPRFITLTLKHSDTPLKNQIDRLTNSLRKLRRQKPWLSHVNGGVYVIEVTYNPKSQTWHPHLHIIADGSYWQQKEISDLWLKVTGDSCIVDITRPHSKRHIIEYVTKYVTKTNTPENVGVSGFIEWIEAVHGLRMIQTFGNVHGVKAEKPEGRDLNRNPTILPLRALEHDAEHGDSKAAELFDRCITAAETPIPKNDTKKADAIVGAHERLGHELRLWWAERMGTRGPTNQSLDQAQNEAHDKEQSALFDVSSRPPPAMTLR